MDLTTLSAREVRAVSSRVWELMALSEEAWRSRALSCRSTGQPKPSCPVTTTPQTDSKSPARLADPTECHLCYLTTGGRHSDSEWV